VTAWTAEVLEQLATDEIGLATRRSDGTLRPFVTMWIVTVDDEVYVRSAGGPDRPWYRRALTSDHGRLRVGGAEHDVHISHADGDAPHERLDEAYHAKYDRYGARTVGSVTGSDAHLVTLRLTSER
jgi:hypothetical protein